MLPSDWLIDLKVHSLNEEHASEASVSLVFNNFT